MSLNIRSLIRWLSICAAGVMVASYAGVKLMDFFSQPKKSLMRLGSTRAVAKTAPIAVGLARGAEMVWVDGHKAVTEGTISVHAETVRGFRETKLDIENKTDQLLRVDMSTIGLAPVQGNTQRLGISSLDRRTSGRYQLVMPPHQRRSVVAITRCLDPRRHSPRKGAAHVPVDYELPAFIVELLRQGADQQQVWKAMESLGSAWGGHGMTAGFNPYGTGWSYGGNRPAILSTSGTSHLPSVEVTNPTLPGTPAPGSTAPPVDESRWSGGVLPGTGTILLSQLFDGGSTHFSDGGYHPGPISVNPVGGVLTLPTPVFSSINPLGQSQPDNHPTSSGNLANPPTSTHKNSTNSTETSSGANAPASAGGNNSSNLSNPTSPINPIPSPTGGDGSNSSGTSPSGGSAPQPPQTGGNSSNPMAGASSVTDTFMTSGGNLTPNPTNPLDPPAFNAPLDFALPQTSGGSAGSDSIPSGGTNGSVPILAGGDMPSTTPSGQPSGGNVNLINPPFVGGGSNSTGGASGGGLSLSSSDSDLGITPTILPLPSLTGGSSNSVNSASDGGHSSNGSVPPRDSDSSREDGGDLGNSGVSSIENTPTPPGNTVIPITLPIDEDGESPSVIGAVSSSAVPEPTPLILLLIGLAGLAVARRRRQR